MLHASQFICTKCRYLHLHHNNTCLVSVVFILSIISCFVRFFITSSSKFHNSKILEDQHGAVDPVPSLEQHDTHLHVLACDFGHELQVFKYNII